VGEDVAQNKTGCLPNQRQQLGGGLDGGLGSWRVEVIGQELKVAEQGPVHFPP